MKVEYKQLGESYHIQQYFSSTDTRTNIQNTKGTLNRKWRNGMGE